MTISLAAAFAQWQELAESIPKDDGPMMAESWNDYTDSLTKDGELTALQYHYAPAYDDAMPGEGSRYSPLSDDVEFILDAMGIRMTTIRAHVARYGWDAAASHYRCRIARGEKSMRFAYSMGSAHTAAPQLPDVIESLLSDADNAGDDFADWCANLGMDDDSRKAHATWKACKRIAASMARLFTESEMSDLREMVQA